MRLTVVFADVYRNGAPDEILMGTAIIGKSGASESSKVEYNFLHCAKEAFLR